MDIIKAIILGLIQGLTEFLPISSSGHLLLAENLLGFHQPDLSFEVFLHLGSLVAVLIYFRKDIIKLLQSLFLFRNKSSYHEGNRNIVFYLLVSTMVTGLMYFFLKDYIDKAFDTAKGTGIFFVSVMLAITGVILYLSDLIESGKRNMASMGLRRSAFIGLGQSLALLPGISRSGTTIALTVFSGVNREDATRYSFLLSIPAILGANITHISDLAALSSELWIQYIAGFIAAFLSGYLVIRFLINMVKKQKLKYFSYYVWAVALVFITIYLVG